VPDQYTPVTNAVAISIKVHAEAHRDAFAVEFGRDPSGPSDLGWAEGAFADDADIQGWIRDLNLAADDVWDFYAPALFAPRLPADED
jgi:hypothetical protein